MHNLAVALCLYLGLSVSSTHTAYSQICISLILCRRAYACAHLFLMYAYVSVYTHPHVLHPCQARRPGMTFSHTLPLPLSPASIPTRLSFSHVDS
ncbi:hypothetical protein GGS23DRAFT_589398 [Durotheca rogersii]|uniref:uncharacterized protein n=1 Tax=Durotheca rogersii TaxID=419775 RepID=UPI00221F56E6|nr:uncharacterized protein GGS23DRAFT_589398 [Durotheca rogersii]KAI5856174.1 hypothetical protein GGS23DRAFT_589398 [Durotheca rogersii]